MKSFGADGTPTEVLLVEDSPADLRETQAALRSANRRLHLHEASDGNEALAFLRHEGEHTDAPRPDLILLDPNLPKVEGREVLAQIRADDSLKTIPTIVLKTSESETDLVEGSQAEANCFLHKPARLSVFASVVKSMNGFWRTKSKRGQPGQNG